MPDSVTEMSFLTQVQPSPRDDEHYRPLPTARRLHETQRPSSASLVPDLTGQVTLQDRYAAAHGGFADVYIGTCHWKQTRPLKVNLHLLIEFLLIFPDGGISGCYQSASVAV